MREAKKYDANFTAGGLFYNEFSNLRSYLLDRDFEVMLKEDVEENKLLAIDTLSARKRIVSEISRRYQIMPSNFWEFFQALNEHETKLALFFICLKTYPIVFDLHFQVSLSKYKMGLDLGEYDIQMRLDELSTVSDDVDSWSESTLKKINTQYRKTLKDAGLYNGVTLHRPGGTNDQFWDYFKENDEAWFLQACFM